ncbi:HAD-IIIC family phosphatase [Acetivibrio ethanolgignens]|uniref:HAD family hydrolase n=1 Tax=Acetivibrio ethanolgignens TaxID=290052 RepID=A0A0V8QE20_9FIRM|nr:HAD-IIIC family phosphatase [Acetivibrio ethanolgignens]KSV58816.1 HAD family hydrolase [Acetivibrio ethanolgignens]
MKELEYPFDSAYILKKKKAIKRTLLENERTSFLEKKIAILGGSTTDDIKAVLELFLLNFGIKASFYESEYAQYWQDVMFDNQELVKFAPDLIYIHTTARNVSRYPEVSALEQEISELLEDTEKHYTMMWDKIAETYHCPIIQNNFELPFYRLLGNKDATVSFGRVNFITELNRRFYRYANTHENFYINDINYLSACYGIQKWADPFYWHMYKYGLAVPAIPELAFNIANIIKSIYGKNRKAFALDLDNTLWGGIVGDDGAENIEIGQETSVGQIYSEFQSYLKAHKDLGIMLNINSKNDYENAIAGLSRPDSVLTPEDFIVIRANWNPKDRNIEEILRELNIGADSLVFVDDNPAERHIVSSQIEGIAVPEIQTPETYIRILDRSGFFEVTSFSEDDVKRNAMYKENMERKQQEVSFSDYGDYLRFLEMKAEIGAFSPIYMSRIAQLTNKSNQFNLTTKRCSQSDIEGYAKEEGYITLYGKLEDKFGDNGVVSVVFGHQEEAVFHIDLWLMSCRVLKRDMEFAMMDVLVKRCQERGIERLIGYYYPTAKNKMVKDFYALQGFSRVSENENGDTVWELDLKNGYTNKNKYIKVVD